MTVATSVVVGLGTPPSAAGTAESYDMNMLSPLTGESTTMLAFKMTSAPDGTLYLADSGGRIARINDRSSMGVSPTTNSQGTSARLYIAYFLRQPDRPGYEYWASKLDQGVGQRDISWNFANGKEFQARYGGLDNARFVDLVYNNVMCRTPDPTGETYWLSLLDNGLVTRSDLMLEFSQSPEFRVLTGT